MKWVKFRIKTITEAEDVIISTLYDIGLEGAQIEDKIPLTALEKEQMFVDILPEGPEDDGIAYLSFFVEKKEDGSLEVMGEPTDVEAILENVKNELEDLRFFMEIGEVIFRTSTTLKSPYSVLTKILSFLQCFQQLDRNNNIIIS